jgi:5-dehydro-2-deoxygluconokinase
MVAQVRPWTRTMADRAGSLLILDVLTIGRVVIDLYPTVDGITLDHVETFQRYLGGSPTNVAVAAARLGHDAAVITRTGDDPFAGFVHRELLRLGVRDDYVSAIPGANTTLAFCEIFPPDTFPLYFVQGSPPPDLMIEPDDLDLEAIARARVFWATLSGLSRDPSRAAHHAAWDARGRRAFTVLDLDYRASYWESPDQARAAGRRAIERVNVVVGNLREHEIVVGESDPVRAADALMAEGVELAIIKMGPGGVLARSRHHEARVPAVPVKVVNGLGAGDGFGGALCHGLLSELPLHDLLRFASAAGAIVATRRGCSTAMPTRSQVEALLGTSEPGAGR